MMLMHFESGIAELETDPIAFEINIRCVGLYLYSSPSHNPTWSSIAFSYGIEVDANDFGALSRTLSDDSMVVPYFLTRYVNKDLRTAKVVRAVLWPIVCLVQSI